MPVCLQAKIERIQEITNGLKAYFDKTLRPMLLYPEENGQADALLGEGKVLPSAVYGGEHLLRLFRLRVQPELAAISRVDEIERGRPERERRARRRGHRRVVVEKSRAGAALEVMDPCGCVVERRCAEDTHGDEGGGLLGSEGKGGGLHCD